MNIIKKFYNAIAEESAERWYSIPLLQPIIKEFLSFLPDNPRILDLGCGAGYESMRLSRAGAEVVGIDFSEEALKIAIQRNPHCKFYLLDFANISPELGNFDGVFASASLIHVSSQELSIILNKISPLISNGGIFLVILKHGVGYKENWIEIYNKKLYGSFHGYTPALVILIFEKHGYSYMKDSYLDKELQDEWFCMLFRKEGDI